MLRAQKYTFIKPQSYQIIFDFHTLFLNIFSIYYIIQCYTFWTLVGLEKLIFANSLILFRDITYMKLFRTTNLNIYIKINSSKIYHPFFSADGPYFAWIELYKKFLGNRNLKYSVDVSRTTRAIKMYETL